MRNSFPSQFRSLSVLSILYSCLVLLTLSSCATLEVGVEITPQPDIQLTSTVSALSTENSRLATLIALPTPTKEIGTPTPTLSVTSVPTPTQLSPNFKTLRFSTTPNTTDTQRFYIAGVPRIYSVWDYSNMSEGMTVKRVWTLNGESWIEKDEPWDFSKYGANGTMQGISIFDDNIGLQAGEYSLKLFVDGVLQDMGKDQNNLSLSNFWIFPPDISGSTVSPDKNYTAFVNRGGQLSVEDPSGKLRELDVVPEISSLSWFPDSRHILYTEADRSKQVSPTEDWGITHKLWVLDITNGEKHLIGTTGENFHSPLISPTARYIAVLSGSTFTQFCSASPSLEIMELDSEFRRKAIYTVNNFAGLAYADPAGYGIYPIDHNSPGRWEGDSKFVSGMWWICLSANQKPDGLYLFDLAKMTAERVGDLP